MKIKKVHSFCYYVKIIKFVVKIVFSNIFTNQKQIIMKMKFLKFMAISLLGGLVVFTGCKDDPDPIVYDDPTVTIAEGASLVLVPANGPTHELSLTVSIDAPGKIENIKIQRNKYLGTTLVDEYEVTNQEHYNLTETVLNYTDNINFDPFFAGTIDKIEYVFIANDREGNFGDASYEITMGAYTALTTEVTTGEIWKLHGDGKACWDLNGDVAVTAIGNAEAVVATRYIINSDEVNTHSTDANFTGSWTSNTVSWTSTGGTDYVTNGNGAQYVKANGYDYANAPKEVALYLFGAGTPSTDVENPEVDDIYIGKLGEELYVIKITENDIDAVYEPKLNTGVLRFTYKK